MERVRRDECMVGEWVRGCVCVWAAAFLLLDVGVWLGGGEEEGRVGVGE